jgi:hypothetical protein
MSRYVLNRWDDNTANPFNLLKLDRPVSVDNVIFSQKDG